MPVILSNPAKEHRSRRDPPCNPAMPQAQIKHMKYSLSFLAGGIPACMQCSPFL
jgi:hypothetical protein